jgi:hypothetical protein
LQENRNLPEKSVQLSHSKKVSTLRNLVQDASIISSDHETDTQISSDKKKDDNLESELDEVTSSLVKENFMDLAISSGDTVDSEPSLASIFATSNEDEPFDIISKSHVTDAEDNIQPIPPISNGSSSSSMRERFICMFTYTYT